MKLKHTKVATLAATLITFGSLAGGVNAAVIINIFNDGTKVTISSIGGTVDLTEMSIETTGLGASNYLFHGSSSSAGVLGSDPGDSTTTGNLTYFDGFSIGNGFIAAGTFTIGNQTILITEIGEPGGNDDILFFPTGWTSGKNTLNEFSFTTTSDIDVESIGFTNGSSAVWTAESGDTVTIQIIPEPSSAFLLGLGALGFAARRRRTN